MVRFSAVLKGAMGMDAAFSKWGMLYGMADRPQDCAEFLTRQLAGRESRQWMIAARNIAQAAGGPMARDWEKMIS